MKRLIVLLLAAIPFIACKKTGTETSPVVGQWEWFKATGGIGNIYMTPQNSGHSWQLTLNANYTSSQTGDLMISGGGTYTLTEDPGTVPPKKLVKITTNGATLTYAYSFISRDTLRLDENLETDGLSYFLVRE